jgi:hypothetical protein
MHAWAAHAPASCVPLAQFELAHAPGTGYIGFLCMWACLTLVVLATVRVKADLATGLVTGVVFAITLIQGQFTWPGRRLWGQARAPACPLCALCVPPLHVTSLMHRSSIHATSMFGRQSNRQGHASLQMALGKGCRPEAN